MNMNLNVTMNEDVVSALGMAIADRQRTVQGYLKHLTSEQWRKTYAAELKALELAKEALCNAEIVI
ncbi:hypothetical protein [Paenibacillus paeoniae]|uniref:Uncharacterized protein n=1 Tax=Paenibacillus paeoniae TaxID=2292705 RepID=A0A371P098_9BACL|nr:hypothetical protein [Paenibacillus paeoniae]REK69359.1 hypothetical protein DX130_24675 [Paenibacillus paeoniae]